MTISEILHLLGREYGSHDWQPHQDPISELIRTVLSQNTSDVNTRRAFDGLTATFGSWEAVAASSAGEIAASIRSGGLAGVKSLRIKQVLQQLEEQCSLDLGFLARLPLEEAKAWLRRLPGVGPKTAGCVLLFSLGMPALPVDTHVYRVSRRLGLLNSGVSPEQAHRVLEALVPPESIYQFHLQMVEHGRRVCKSRRPLCHQCVLGKGCPTRS
jgi:endonuclease-3